MNQWQPIETAPKDGTPILAGIKGYTPVVVLFLNTIKRFIPCNHLDMTGDFASELDEDLVMCTEWNPTHWMPLPPTPEDV